MGVLKAIRKDSKEDRQERGPEDHGSNSERDSKKDTQEGGPEDHRSPGEALKTTEALEASRKDSKADTQKGGFEGHSALESSQKYSK